MTKYYNITLKSLFIFALLIIVNIGNAQSSKKEEPRKEFKEQLWYGINIGNISIGNGVFSTGLSLMGGYKITNSIRTGLILHGNYAYYWTRGSAPNYRVFDFGFGGLINADIYKSYFAQLEVDKMYLTTFDTNGKSQNPYLMTYIGGGYRYYSSSKWSTILTLLYNVNPDSNQIFFPLDYRMAFVYNF